MRPMLAVGVDGCRGGWIAVAFDPSANATALTPRVHPDFASLLASFPENATIGVDIPIGLSVDGPRRCDIEARRLLGPRRSSVFPAPDPRLLDAVDYRDALARARALTGKGISRQAFNIFAKVAEVDRLMTPALQRRVVEVHPEICFRSLNGGAPMRFSKRRPEGFAERRQALEAALALALPDRAAARSVAPPAAPDDLLDAYAAAWSARRWLDGHAQRIPTIPQIDARGRRMEIVY
jgi:predicted RNase H-like nuclease